MNTGKGALFLTMFTAVLFGAKLEYSAMSYRIIQWSSGNVGKHAITTIAGREGMELAALYVYSEEKSGVDAGSIAGIGTLGITATDDRDRILASEADCVIHTPLPSLVYGEAPDEDLETICALLASGKKRHHHRGVHVP